MEIELIVWTFVINAENLGKVIGKLKLNFIINDLY